MSPGPVLRFDEFEIDIDAGELRRRGRKVRLAPQPFRLLAMLAGSQGRIVDREAIRKQLWESTFVDFEHGVNFCVSEIIGFCARLAVALSTFQLALFLFVVWIPIVAAGSRGTFQWSETILNTALLAGAWMVADS